MIYNADCMAVLMKLGYNQVDLISTDPPYGMSFMGKDWDRAISDLKIWQECLRVLKPGAFLFVMCAPRSDLQWRMSQRLEEAGFRVDFSPIYWSFATGFSKGGNIGKMVDKKMGEKPLSKAFVTAGKGDRKDLQEDNTPTLKYRSDYGYVHKLKNKEAKALDGSYAGLQMKPAVEIILVCQKPLFQKTYVEQALDNKKGISWLDDCRIPYESEDVDTRRNAKGGDNGLSGSSTFKIRERKASEQPKQQGRFPANLLVSDDVLNDGRITKPNSGGIRKAGSEFGQTSGWNSHKNINTIKNTIKDSGSYSRFFSLDAWAEKTLPFLIVAKPSKAEKNRGCESNNHPTCKPIKLMSYLITMGSRQGNLVCDPFLGSGTTGIAAKQLGRKFIGREMNKDYFEIADARINHQEVQAEMAI